ncbi:peptidoglycan bridge formation glycyltransferase FemA/FemB family protein [Patescibacteria group bacterium AH-259-L05]|nr:peptidoglycan bridge formation glycyltransferase FemA/FemB family protein [Patescibacteria group bacterium AH-259-L05]
MQVIEAKNQKEWDEFIISNRSQFLQSWVWGEFQKKLGRRIWRLGVVDRGSVIGQALLVKHILPLGKSYFYCPRGPLFSSSPDKKALEILFNKIKELAKQENIIFFRFEPLDQNFLSIVYSLRFKVVAVRPVQPSQTLILDITKLEDELLSGMHEKIRYNIRLAKRRGVEIGESNDVKAFLSLLHQTARREKFKPHPDVYYSKLLDIGPHFIKLYTATYKGKILAVHMMIFLGNTTTYVHGASSREYKEVMAPHLLHWYTIQTAKQKGYQWYDLWGIDEKKWPGLTRFKKGFGGKSITYPGTFEIPFFQSWYRLYRLGKIFV